MIKVSIIVPVYNVERYLSKCLDSLINQTYKNIEIICVNDGSLDTSLQILQTYQKKDQRIQIIDQQNQGLSGARNSGIKCASGDYILFVDSDDWIELQTVERCIEQVQSDLDIDVVVFGTKIVMDSETVLDNNLVELLKDYHQVKFAGRYEINNDIILQTPVVAWNKLYKKSILEKYKIFFPEGLLYEDNEFFYKYYLHGKIGYYIQENLYNYLQRSDSIMGQSRQKKSNKIVDRITIFSNVYGYYKYYNAIEKYKRPLSSLFYNSFYCDYTYCSDSARKKVLEFVYEIISKIKIDDFDLDFLEKNFIENIQTKKYHKISFVDHINLLKKIFSIGRDGEYKILRFLGCKFRLYRRKKYRKQIQQKISDNLFSLSKYTDSLNKQIMTDFLGTRVPEQKNLRNIVFKSTNVMGFYYHHSLQDMRQNLKILFSAATVYSNDMEDNQDSVDLFYLWGIKPSAEQSRIIEIAQKLKRPVVMVEDGFLRSACSWVDDKPLKYRVDCAFTVDDLTMYYDARTQSRLEFMLNDKSLVISEEQKNRARRCIDNIIDNYLTKYNHQPIYHPNIGRSNVKKVLVIDQSYGDMSITAGMGCHDTFKEMLDCAINENPDADIIVKTHPDTLSGQKGYYSDVKQSGRIYTQTSGINPISLLQYVDKVYVCTTQFGFEALMCKKEVHVFGMPFYAGWGLTHDRQNCVRRTHQRTLEEVFYIAYIMYSYYIDPRKQAVCEIEDVMDYLLELRAEYFEKFNINYERLDIRNA